MACQLYDTGGMWITLPSMNPRSFSDLPVHVTASKKGRDDLRGTGTMKFTADKGPCACPHSEAAVTLA